MKNINLIFSILCCSLCFAQNFEQVYDEKVNNEKMFLITQEANSTKKQKLQPKNLVFILQQGNDNTSSVKVKAKNGNIQVSQLGDNNLVDIDIVAKNVKEKIEQIGNGHVFIDHDKFNARGLHQVEVLQQGEKHKIIMEGKNILSERIKITQQGANKTIYINNFK